jgi:DNA-binding transcriptional regulator YiaG
VTAKKFKNLRDKMSPERPKRIDAMANEMLSEMPMHELRRARQLSQVQLAEILDVKQGPVSKLERRTDLYISTLRRYIEAMGGELELQADFSEGSVTIAELGQIEEPDEDAANAWSHGSIHHQSTPNQVRQENADNSPVSRSNSLITTYESDPLSMPLW